MKTYWRISVAAIVLVALLPVIYANLSVLRYLKFTHNSVHALPNVKACLVLGTSKRLSNHKENLYYTYRIEAAKHVYDAGKCSKLVLSGDNRHPNYNEPETMKRSLVALGVPASDLFCDYGGRRTLDSVLRFKSVFGQTSGIVVSQAFHNARAIYIADAHNMSLVGFNAKDVDTYHGIRTQLREIVSRVRAVADVNLFYSQPRHHGDQIQL